MKIQKLQNYKPKDTRKAVPTHYTLLFDAYLQNRLRAIWQGTKKTALGLGF